MEIVLRYVDGRLNLQSNVQDKVQLLGMLEFAKAAVLQQPAVPGVQIPGPDLARKLIGANGHG